MAEKKNLNLYQRLLEVHKSCDYLKKENEGNQYSYVSSSQVLQQVRKKMEEMGIMLMPSIIDKTLTTYEDEVTDRYDNKKIRRTHFTELVMEMAWVNVDNPDDKKTCAWYAQGVDIAGEKGVGKALTYAEKYFMLKTFNIPTDKDDPDAFQKKSEKARPKSEPKPPAVATAKQVKMFNTLGNQIYGDDWEKKKQGFKDSLKVDSTKSITKKDMKIILDKFTTLAEKKDE